MPDGRPWSFAGRIAVPFSRDGRRLRRLCERLGVRLRALGQQPPPYAGRSRLCRASRNGSGFCGAAAAHRRSAGHRQPVHQHERCNSHQQQSRWYCQRPRRRAQEYRQRNATLVPVFGGRVEHWPQRLRSPRPTSGLHHPLSRQLERLSTNYPGGASGAPSPHPKTRSSRPPTPQAL